jgi:hypothetical protein
LEVSAVFRRDLSPETVAALLNSPLWQNLIADRELQPEIRGGHVTVYYYGGALLGELRLRDGVLVASVQPKYVPVSSVASANLRLTDTPAKGLQFEVAVPALPPGQGEPEVLRLYKERMVQVRMKEDPEDWIVQAILTDSRNAVVDQQIAFAESGSDRDRIDLCYFDDPWKTLVFVEVKRRNDHRLVSDGGRPEVLDQLENYGRRLRDNQVDLLDAYKRVVVLKRELGLGPRLDSVPPDGPGDLLEKPLLVIWGCSDADIPRIKEGKDVWAPLIAGLRYVASGLILCGDQGCKLVLCNSYHTVCYV